MGDVRERIHSTYLTRVLDFGHRYRVLERAVEAATKMHAEYSFDAVVFTGMSGALIAPAVADALGLDLLIVRKPSDDSHHSSENWRAPYLDGYIQTGARLLWVDDVVSSGRTFARVQREIDAYDMVIAGILLYSADLRNSYIPSEIPTVCLSRENLCHYED